jgi:predicted ATPase/DNA-binding SARP family transcriptional activator
MRGLASSPGLGPDRTGGAVGGGESGEASLRLRALGPLEAWRDGEAVPLGGDRQRRVLAALLCARDRPRSTGQLVQAVWGDDPPPSAVGSLQAYLSRLRRLLGAELIVRDAAGYRLRVPPSGVDIDTDAFERDLEAADAARTRGDLDGVAAHCRTALDRWRGNRFLGELGSEAFAAGDAARFEQLRRQALGTWIDAALELGHYDAAIAELEGELEEEPFDEHRWAQLMIAHHRSGRPLDALLAYRRADRRLRDDLGVEPGARLRDLEARILAQDPGLAVRARDAGRRATALAPTNLRDSSTSFVGRDEALDTVVSQLATDRLVTVVGIGGVGKTRLAVEAGWRLLANAPGGVWDVDLAPVAEPTTIARPLALALQVPYRTGDPGLARYADRIGDRATIVLLDNCEHQLDAVATLVAELLARCPGLRVLATSQVALGLEGESVVELAPLPDDGTSLELFVDRARAVAAGFQVTAVNRAAVEEVLCRLDGLPLAIELAAATLDLLTPRLLAARLADGLAALQRPDAADPRHVTLWSTLDWSYELLAEPEQRVLERLAVFAGPFDGPGAAAVGTGDPVAPDDIRAALETLARRSLLVPAAPAADGSSRWRLLEVVRTFGRARLRARGELEAVRTRHLEHLCHLVAAAADHLHDAEQVHAVAQLRELDADLDVALATAAERGDRDRLMALIDGAWLWWYLDERHDDALRWLDEVATDDEVPPHLLAAGALVHAVQLEAHHRERALARADQASARVAATDDPAERAYVRLLVGDALTRSPQRFAEATGPLDAAAAHFAQHGPAWAEGWALLRRIRVDGLLHADLTTARTRLARAVDRLETADDRQLLAYAQLIVANMARLHGTLQDGLEAIGAAVRSYAELGYVLQLREARHLEALLLTELGRLDETADHLQAQLSDAGRTGSSTGRFFATLGLAEVHARRGDLGTAHRMLEQLAAVPAGDGDAGARGSRLVVMTRVAGLLARDPADRARVQTLNEGLLATWGDGPVPWHQVRAHLAVAEAALALDELQAAARHLDEAAAIAGRIEQPHRLAEVAEARAVLAARDGDDGAVLALLGEASRLRAATGAAAWQYVAERTARLVDGACERLGAEAADAARRRGGRSAGSVEADVAAHLPRGGAGGEVEGGARQDVQLPAAPVDDLQAGA